MIRFLLLTVASGAALAAPELTVPRHGTAEIVLHSAAPYNGTTGSPNPFTEVSLELQVTSPTGRTFSVEGFFDGDGAGGAVGDVFKVRVYADEPGSWSWTSASSDPGLHGDSGSFAVSGTLPGRWGRGGLGIRPSAPRHFSHADGTPFFVAGKFLDQAIGGTIGSSLPMFSEVWTDANRRALLDRAHALSANKMAVYLANKGDFSAQWPVTPWLGNATTNDKTRFDLARWRLYDQWTVTMRDEGLAAQFWFFADNSSFGTLPLADRQRLIRYGMARLSAYANTLFILALEWDEGWTVADVDACAEYLQARNPWRRPHSVHCLAWQFDFPDRAWADYMATQTGLGAAYTATHSRNLANRALAAKPLVDEEFSFGAEDTLGRQETWAAFSAGVAGVGTGVFLAQLMNLVAELDVERMAPDDGLVLAGSAMVLAERGRQYVAYLGGGGNLTLDLSHTSGSFQARWFDPRDSSFDNPVTVQAGGSISLTTPTSGDWALHLRRTCSGSSVPPSVTGLHVDPAGTITWNAVAGADGYDTVVGDLYALAAGGLSGSLRGCLERNGADTLTLDPGSVGPQDGRYYLVRARHCSGTLGSYDAGEGLAGPRDADLEVSGNDCP